MSPPDFMAKAQQAISSAEGERSGAGAVPGEGRPASAADSSVYDAWFRAKVLEAMEDRLPTITHYTVMDEAQAVIDGKRCAEG